MRYRPFSADIPENPAVSGGETYWERQARTLSNLYRTNGRLERIPLENGQILQIWEIVLAAVLMWFSCRSPEFTPLGGCECAVCSAAIIGLVSTRRYSSVLPLQDCLVICYLRFDPDTSCKLPSVLPLTNCLVIGVQEDADDISHRPLFPVSFPEAAKDLFLAAEEKRI